MEIKQSVRIILSALLFAGCTATQQEKQQAEAANLRIAYNVYFNAETDDYEVFSMNLDGSDQRNVTNLGGVEWTYYAYKNTLFFISDKDTTHRHYYLYETNALGEAPKKVTGYRLKDSWMSSRNAGQEIIVNPRVEGDSAFYIISSNTGQLLSKLYTGKRYYNDPVFSPDGQQVVFRGADQPFKKDTGYRDELYIINADGSGLTQLTHYPEKDTTAQWWEYHAGAPFWEPNRNIISYCSVQNGLSSLFQINPDGKGGRKITPDSLSVTWHSWSPDGKWLAFDGHHVSDTTHNYDIYLMDYEAQNIRRLTTDTTGQNAPVFVEY